MKFLGGFWLPYKSLQVAINLTSQYNQSWLNLLVGELSTRVIWTSQCWDSKTRCCILYLAMVPFLAHPTQEITFQMNSIPLFLWMASSFSHMNSKTWSLSEFVLCLNPFIQCSPLAVFLSSIFSFLPAMPVWTFCFTFGCSLVTHPCHINLVKHSIYPFITPLENLTPICSVLNVVNVQLLSQLSGSDAFKPKFSFLRGYSWITKFIPHVPLSLYCVFSSAWNVLPPLLLKPCPSFKAKIKRNLKHDVLILPARSILTLFWKSKLPCTTPKVLHWILT